MSDELEMQNGKTKEQIEEEQEEEIKTSMDLIEEIDHTKDQIRLKKLMKKALETTNISKILLQDTDGVTKYWFSEFYEYKSMLGCGGFGFVVSAIDHETGNEVALKVS